ncbi:MAG: hydroxyacylglutathione hydrolase [Proteobacteria bacterium]|nr:MAG: hydroxyacylglutathione hydrolase [Pseudomonadota bacterium]
MRVELISVLNDNYAYLVVCEQTGLAAAVDPADPEPVVARVEELGVELVAIWNTHHHWDHTSGNEALCEAAGARALEVYAHASDKGRVPGQNRGVEHGAKVGLGQLEATVFHTPGHTRGGIVYQLEDAAFTGDSLFAAGCGRLFEGTAEMMYSSLNEVLAPLPDETKVYCGHEYTQKNIAFGETVDGENPALAERKARVDALREQGAPSIPSTLAEERATNPFLRCGDERLRAQLVARFPDERFDDDVAVFAKLRGLRDRF